MATKIRIFSSLALTTAALFVVPLSSEEAVAKGGGMRSVGVVRTSPAVTSRARTVKSTSQVYKQSTLATASHRKLNTTQAGAKLKSSQASLKSHGLREVEKDPNKGDSGKGDHGGKLEKEKPIKRHRVIYPVGLGIGAAPAAVAVDPPGCVYERSVRKLPGGGLQRVIVKVCPDA